MPFWQTCRPRSVNAVVKWDTAGSKGLISLAFGGVDGIGIWRVLAFEICAVMSIDDSLIHLEDLLRPSLGAVEGPPYVDVALVQRPSLDVTLGHYETQR